VADYLTTSLAALQLHFHAIFVGFVVKIVRVIQAQKYGPFFSFTE
jgi:hypothetical protein